MKFAGEQGNVRAQIHLRPVDLDEVRREAQRLERTQGWIVCWAWKIARDTLRKLPSRTDGVTEFPERF